MAIAEVEGFACVEARLSLPRAGVWTLDAVIDTADSLSGSVSATVGALALTGTVLRAEVFLGSLRVRIVGGAGGMSSRATPKFWQQTTLRSVASTMLSLAGESLDSTSALTAWAQWYAVGSGSVGSELSKIAAQQGSACVWRVLPGGSVWVGEDSWSASDADDVELDRDPIDRVLVLGTESPSLLPGTTYSGLRIDLVEHIVKPDAVRTLAWWAA